MVTLEQLMGGDPGAFFERQKAVNTQQQRSEADLASILQQTDQRRQMQPLNMRAQELSNLTSEAQLPGIVANSNSQVLNNKKQSLTFDSDIEAHIAGNKGKVDEQFVKELNNTGNVFTQAGQYLSDAPGVATHAMARQLLGKYYRPEFDKISPQALGGAIKYIGENMTNAGTAFQQKLLLLQQKQAGDLEIARMRSASAERISQQAAAAKAAGDKKSLEQLSAQYKMLADQETDPDKKKFYESEYARMLDDIRYIKPQPAPKPIVNTEQTGGALIDPPAPVNPRGANNSGDRVRVQTPDGRVGSIPRAQLQNALAKGYKEIK